MRGRNLKLFKQLISLARKTKPAENHEAPSFPNEKKPETTRTGVTWSIDPEQLATIAPSKPIDNNIEIPRTEPGWNINAEVYFRKELKPLAGSEIVVTLKVVDEEDDGWDETNLIYMGKKVGQLPVSYHIRMAPHFRALRSHGKVLKCVARVSDALELKLLVPYPETLIPFLTNGFPPGSATAGHSAIKRWVRVKESGKYQAALRALSEKLDSNVWTGTAICRSYAHAGGKYDGQSGVEVFVGAERIGAIGPRYADDLLPISRAIDEGVVEFECRIELSKFEEEKLFATLLV
jgi:hypothetical protein